MSDEPRETSLNADRPLATFGLRLGLMVTFMLLGVAPIIKFYVAIRLNAGESDVALGVPYDIWSQAVGLGSGLTLLATILAWRGRPPAIHWIFQVIVILNMAAIIVEAIVRYNSDCPNCVIQFSQDVINRAFRYLIPVQIATLIYVLWYINRSPARAYYQNNRTLDAQTERALK